MRAESGALRAERAESLRSRRAATTKGRSSLIDLLFEARDLLSELLYLVLQVFFPASYPGVAGFEEGADASYGANGVAA